MVQKAMQTSSSQRVAKRKAKPSFQPVLELPPLSADEIAALRSSIALNGVLVPILVDSDGARRKIIDGNYRKKIANELGYDCPEVVQAGLTEEEKRVLARCLNLARRQLNHEQRRRLIADQLRETPDWSNRWVGKRLGVHHTTVGSVRTSMESTGQISQLIETVGQDGKRRTYAFRRGSYPSDPKSSVIETPAGISRFLHDLISPRYRVRTILDPCAGSGSLTRPWSNRRIIAFEMAAGSDFFACSSPVRCDLVLCNPPFNESGRKEKYLPERFLEQILEVVPTRTPIVLFVPMGMRLNQQKTSTRWRWLRDQAPQITSIISLPLDVFPGVKFHTEVLLFNMPQLKPHYFLADEYVDLLVASRRSPHCR